MHLADVLDADLMHSDQESGPRTNESHIMIGSAPSDLVIVELQAAAMHFGSGLSLFQVLCEVSTIV